MKDKKKIYIHIGPHKTGTTTIQIGLFNNREVLLRKGILVPTAGDVFPNVCGNHNLVWELRGDDRFYPSAGLWKDLLQEITETKAEKIIITSEDFAFLNIDQINHVESLLRDFTVSIVTYTRRQDAVLFSIWTQVLKTGKHENVPISFYHWLESRNYYHPIADYANLYRNWAMVFGEENLIIRVLEKTQMRGTLFQDFLFACGNINTDKIIEPENQNISPGIKTLVLIQEMQKRIKGGLKSRQREEIIKFLLEFSEKQEWNIKKANLINRDLFNEIITRYGDGNQYIASKYFGRNELFLDTFQEKELTCFKLEGFHAEELLDLFAFEIEKLFKCKSGIVDWEILESEYLALKGELDRIHASRSWKWLQRLRAVRRKMCIRFKGSK